MSIKRVKNVGVKSRGGRKRWPSLRLTICGADIKAAGFKAEQAVNVVPTVGRITITKVKSL